MNSNEKLLYLSKGDYRKYGNVDKKEQCPVITITASVEKSFSGVDKCG